MLLCERAGKRGEDVARSITSRVLVAKYRRFALQLHFPFSILPLKMYALSKPLGLFVTERLAIWVALSSALISLLSFLLTLRNLRWTRELDAVQRRSQLLAELSAVETKMAELDNWIVNDGLAKAELAAFYRITNQVFREREWSDEKYEKQEQEISAEARTTTEKRIALARATVDALNSKDIERTTAYFQTQTALLDRIIKRLQFSTQRTRDHLAFVSTHSSFTSSTNQKTKK